MSIFPNYEYCPICGKKRSLVARDFHRTSLCPNGHIWHTCGVHQSLVLGECEVSPNTCSCTGPIPWILPCPFCGCSEFSESALPTSGEYRITCPTCGARVIGKTQRTTVEKWNTRADV